MLKRYQYFINTNINSMSKKQIVLFIISIVIICLIYIFTSLSLGFNTSVHKIFANIKGEEQPDSNIILVHINSNDIEILGDWPLKRSYYALLINNLTKLNVKKIGLEIFLSEKITSQNIYNNVLNSVIENSNKVVLASLTEDLKIKEGRFVSSGILYPSPKKTIKEAITGHINFIEEEGIIIPGKINSNESWENSFSQILAGTNQKDESIKINFISSWKMFRNYSLLEFFEMLESGDGKLNSFENKFVLVGVSDPLIAKTIRTNFDTELPGLALHAFALDNILNSRNINFNLLVYSKYLFFALILIIPFASLKIRTYVIILSVAFISFFFYGSYSILS